MGDKKLRVQRATINNKSFTILQELKANPTPAVEPGKPLFTDKPEEETIQQIDIPIYATIPSRVIQIINAITAEDVMDDLEYREIAEDIRNVK